MKLPEFELNLNYQKNHILYQYYVEYILENMGKDC